jgi:hypothetical protein
LPPTLLLADHNYHAVAPTPGPYSAALQGVFTHRRGPSERLSTLTKPAGWIMCPWWHIGGPGRFISAIYCSSALQGVMAACLTPVVRNVARVRICDYRYAAICTLAIIPCPCTASIARARPLTCVSRADRRHAPVLRRVRSSSVEPAFNGVLRHCGSEKHVLKRSGFRSTRK